MNYHCDQPSNRRSTYKLETLGHCIPAGTVLTAQWGLRTGAKHRCDLERALKEAGPTLLQPSPADSPTGNHPLPKKYHIELELQTEDTSTVQHWQQPQSKHSWALGWKSHAGTKEDVEVDREGIQLVAQSRTHWPAVLRWRYGSRPFYRSLQGWWLWGQWLVAQ